MTVTVRTRDVNKSELLKIMRDSAAFGDGHGVAHHDGSFERVPLRVWLDEAPALDLRVAWAWVRPGLPGAVKAQITADMRRG